jgi:hypothetical protein
MAADTPTLVKRLYLASTVTLLAGLGVSAALYDRAVDVVDSELVDGFRNSKVFRHELELYGGKMSLMGDRFNQWISGLWQGKQLGITVGCISVVIALALFCIARLTRDGVSPPGAGKGSL